jgi:hypothetical protein
MADRAIDLLQIEAAKLNNAVAISSTLSLSQTTLRSVRKEYFQLYCTEKN